MGVIIVWHAFGFRSTVLVGSVTTLERGDHCFGEI